MKAAPFGILLMPDIQSVLEAVRAQTLGEIVPALLVVVDTAFGVGQPLEFEQNQPESKVKSIFVTTKIINFSVLKPMT